MRRIAAVLAIALGLVAPAAAMTIEEQVLASLRAQGYEILEEGYTFLGRLRIVASNGEIRREIVVNPGTGEILRDYAVMLPRVAAQSPSAGSGHGQGTATASAGGQIGNGPAQDVIGLLSSDGTPAPESTPPGTASSFLPDYPEEGTVLMLSPILPLSDVTQ